jgi:tRNA(Ile2) C34 agmatinyltransferase TiaS
MRGLPFALTSGPLLAQVIRDASDDPRRNTLCSFCGSRMRIKPDRTEQRARCPSCTRWQSVAVTEETPWRLTAASAEALRQTRRWLRGL